MPAQPATGSVIEGVEVRGQPLRGSERILTPDALRFVRDLVRRFRDRLEALLARRREVQAQLDAGVMPDFLPETAAIRERAWTVASIPEDLRDRRVEITGPVDRKMIIYAFNSGAPVFMADFEDATAPTWPNLVQGQINLADAVAGTIEVVSAKDGSTLRLDERTATLIVRPRGWHLPEHHLLIDRRSAPGSLFDFGLFFFHNARALLAKGSGPYLYLPKLENHLEARLWNDVFVWAQESLGVPHGSIRATVLIETILAAFEMDEILYELRDHSAGLNCGRWDYIFSVIKKFRSHSDFVMPDRGTVTMDRHFLRSYTQLVVKTCHRRGAHAIGGMAAQIPNKFDPEANRASIDKVVADKLREVGDGHDGSWVAHPGLVEPVREVFDTGMPGPNQIARQRYDVYVTGSDLLRVPEGPITEAGLRQNITVGIRYLEAWLGGQGAVPIFGLMEDAATSEISRSQIWQWIHHGASLVDGRRVTLDLYRHLRDDELAKLRRELGDARWDSGHFTEASAILDRMVENTDFEEFLTLPAYEELLRLEARDAGGAPD